MTALGGDDGAFICKVMVKNLLRDSEIAKEKITIQLLKIIS